MRLTRRQVAARLGKSIATVRRLEGHVLHPSRDLRGVYRFDLDEVECLCRSSHLIRRWGASTWLTAHTKRSASKAKRDTRVARTQPDPASGENAPHFARVADAIESILATARRSKAISANELIVSADAVAALLEALEQDVGCDLVSR